VIRRSLLEWRSLNHGDHPVEEIPEWAAERLAAAARTSPLAGAGGKRVLVHGRHDLRAQGVVGVVAAKDCSLEILPKIEGCGDGSDSESRGRLRERLVHMLAVALDMKIDVGGGAAISWQRETLLEILIGLFARKLADAVRRGLPRRSAVGSMRFGSSRPLPPRRNDWPAATTRFRPISRSIGS